MNRRKLISAVIAALMGARPNAAKAYQEATPQGTVVGISGASWASIYAYQQGSNWCWAASLQMLFAASRRQVDQKRIVQEVYGGLYNLPAISAAQIASLTNRDWIDEFGMPVSARLTAAYDFNAGVLNINDAMIVDALQAEQPMIICTRHHAMLLTAAEFTMGPNGPIILRMGVFDPWPTRGARGADYPTEFLAAHRGGDLIYIGLTQIT